MATLFKNMPFLGTFPSEDLQQWVDSVFAKPLRGLGAVCLDVSIEVMGTYQNSPHKEIEA